MKKFVKTLIIIGVILVLLIGAAVFAGYMISKGDSNLPNVYVGNVCVGRMTKEQTETVLKAHGWDVRAESPLKVNTIGGQSFEVDSVKAGTTLPVQEAVEKAFAVGHDGNIMENLLTFFEVIIEARDVNALSEQPDEEYIASCVDAGIAKVNEYMGAEEYTVDYDAEELILKKGWGQVEFDEADFCAAILEALRAGCSELSYDKLVSDPRCPNFTEISSKLDAEPQDAAYSDDGKFEVKDEVIGLHFDVSEAEKLWKAAEAGGEVRVPLELERPEITGEALRGKLYHDLLGATTTKFPNSVEARRENLRLALSKIDGLILYPGDEFSYNDVVGERTEEAGFQAAPAYVNGETKDEIGGGVCQVASTLYASTVFAFLETVERECHYYPPNYMQMGTDATVTIPAEGRSINFRFRNNKNYPIMIKTEFNNDESYLTVELWGTLEEGDYMPVCFDNSYGLQFDYVRNIDKADENQLGYTIKLTHETWTFEDDVGPGYRTITHRQVIDPDGNVVQDDIINARRENSEEYAMDTYYVHQEG